MKVNEDTQVAIPLKNLIGLIIGTVFDRTHCVFGT